MKKVEWGRQCPVLNQKAFQLQRKRKKERKIVENYFANTMACFSLAQFNKSREKLLLNTLAGFYTVRLANNVTRTLQSLSYRKCPIFVCDVAFSQRNWQTTVESSLKASFNLTTSPNQNKAKCKNHVRSRKSRKIEFNKNDLLLLMCEKGAIG